jgi:hypothetical protein
MARGTWLFRARLRTGGTSPGEKAAEELIITPPLCRFLNYLAAPAVPDWATGHRLQPGLFLRLVRHTSFRWQIPITTGTPFAPHLSHRFTTLLPSRPYSDSAMNNETARSIRGLSVTSIIAAILGAVFYWWVPLGMVLSLVGLTVGIADWIIASRRSLDARLSIVAVIVAVGALGLDIAIAWLGLEIVRFSALR